jgi:hypothetical protein
MTTNKHDRKEGQQLTAVWRNGGFSASYDSFVGKQTLVLRINICGENPPLRQAAFQDQIQIFKLKIYSFPHKAFLC